MHGVDNTRSAYRKTFDAVHGDGKYTIGFILFMGHFHSIFKHRQHNKVHPVHIACDHFIYQYIMKMGIKLTLDATLRDCVDIYM